MNCKKAGLHEKESEEKCALKDCSSPPEGEGGGQRKSAAHKSAAPVNLSATRDD